MTRHTCDVTNPLLTRMQEPPDPEKLRASGLRVETAVSDGDPRSAIVDAAREWGADLIIVGSHGYTGVKRWLLGSVAQSVVSHAPCSVEVVRQKPDAG